MHIYIRALDKRLQIPLYYQLRMILEERIRGGELKPKDRLPSEEEIAALYGVSKATVRQALNDLAVAGLLHRVQGRGTFVAEARPAQGPRELTGFSEEMHKRGLFPSARVLQQDVIRADEEIAAKLEIPAGRELFRLKRVRLADEIPVGLQTAHVPLELAPRLPFEDFERSSLYDVLARQYHVVPSRAREVHSAVVVNGREAEWLGVAEGSAGLATERLTLMTSGRPMELVHSLMRGDRYQIVLELVKK